MYRLRLEPQLTVRFGNSDRHPPSHVLEGLGLTTKEQLPPSIPRGQPLEGHHHELFWFKLLFVAKPGQNYKANMAKLQSQLQNMVLRIPTYI